MVVRPIKTERLTSGSKTIFEFLDSYIDDLEEKSVLTITSKIVALCERRVADANTDKEELAKAEADYYLPPDESKYHHHFTIIHRTLLGMSGIDESNADGQLVLLPKDPQASANGIRRHLQDKFRLDNLGVIITDSVSIPLRLGAIGACLSYSGFKAVKDYRGQMDLFGRPFKVSQANIAAGLAAAAVLAMGEGAEQTPLAIIRDVPFLEFQSQNPSPKELQSVNLLLEDDLFAPFLKNAPWQKGERQ